MDIDTRGGVQSASASSLAISTSDASWHENTARKHRRSTSPPPSSLPLSYADYRPIYHPTLFRAFPFRCRAPLLVRRFTKLARDPRSPFVSAAARPLVVSWSKLFCPVSPGRAMRYLWVSFGALCRSRHYTGEREKSSPRFCRASSSVSEYGYGPEVWFTGTSGYNRQRRRRWRLRRWRRHAYTSAALLGLFFSVFFFFRERGYVRFVR